MLEERTEVIEGLLGPIEELAKYVNKHVIYIRMIKNGRELSYSAIFTLLQPESVVCNLRIDLCSSKNTKLVLKPRKDDIDPKLFTRLLKLTKRIEKTIKEELCCYA